MTRTSAGSGVLRFWGSGVPGSRGSGVLVLAALAAVASLGAQQAPDRSKPPALGPSPTLKLPPMQKRALANGLSVWIVEMHKVPVVAVSLIVKSGASADPVGKFGLANFTAAMLDEGAGSRTALELADAIEFLGVSLSTGSSFDASVVSLYGPVSKLDDALPLMADIVLRPAFAASEVERLRKERLTSLLQTRDSAPALAGAGFARIVFGPRHRYGTLAMGNDASNGEMTAADLRTFHQQHYQPQRAFIVVAGDVTPEGVLPKLERAFGAWKNAVAPAVPAPAEAAQHASRQIYLIDKPGAEQSAIRIGWIGVDRRTPDYFPIQVANTILGGSFTSRLNQNLREVHGYAYGAGSSFDMRASAGPFMASANVQTDKTVESLGEFFKELEGIRKPVPAEELSRAKNYLALGFPGAFETISGVAGQLSTLVLYGLPESYFNEYIPKILAVTAADVERVALKYIQPDKFAVVVVGDLARIEKPVRDANLGAIRVLTVDAILK